MPNLIKPKSAQITEWRINIKSLNLVHTPNSVRGLGSFINSSWILNSFSPKYKKILTSTFLFHFQLCEEQRCQEEVSILAINYMDRVMNKLPISKNNLQLLAATCIFLASKLREPSARALPPHILIYYTDHSITKRDLMVSLRI